MFSIFSQSLFHMLTQLILKFDKNAWPAIKQISKCSDLISPLVIYMIDCIIMVALRPRTLSITLDNGGFNMIESFFHPEVSFDDIIKWNQIGVSVTQNCRNRTI